MKTIDIKEASALLGAHKETIRRLAASGKIPAVKIGRGWRFITEDLVVFLRSKYKVINNSQDSDSTRNLQCRFTKEMKLGGSASLIMDKEYSKALGLLIK